MAYACLLNANFTTAWAPENYLRSELLMGVNQSFAIMGLVASLVQHAAFSGGLSAPQRALAFAAFFHTVRLPGGEAGGVALMGHFITDREKLHFQVSITDCDRDCRTSAGRPSSRSGLKCGSSG
jgi:hypothetical protein